MKFSPLDAISPIDGRYNSKTQELQQYFSESSLIKFRIQVEIEYFIALCNSSITQLNHFPSEKFETLRKIYSNFSSEDAIRIKEIEKNFDNRFIDLARSVYKENDKRYLIKQEINLKYRSGIVEEKSYSVDK